MYENYVTLAKNTFTQMFGFISEAFKAYIWIHNFMSSFEVVPSS